MAHPTLVNARQALIGYLLMLVTGIGWAGAWITAKIAAHDAPPATVTVGRFVVAALALLPVWFALERTRPRPQGQQWGLLAVMGLLGAATYTVLFLYGVRLAPSSDGAVLTPGFAGVFAMGITALQARKLPAAQAMAGAGLALAGCLLVGWNAMRAAEAGSTRPWGDLLFVLAALVWAVYTVIGKRASGGGVGPVTSILAVSVVGAVALAPLALLLDGPPQLSSWGRDAWVNVLYLGLGATAVAFVTYYAAIQIIGVDRAAPAMGLVPLFGVLGAAFILDEPLTLLHALGGALVVAGIALPPLWANLRARRVRAA